MGKRRWTLRIGGSAVWRASFFYCKRPFSHSGKGFPDEFVQYLTYCENLEFEDGV